MTAATPPQPAALSRLARLICEDRSTRKNRQAGQVGVVGDGEWLTIGEAVQRLNALGRGRYNDQRVRRVADAGFLLVDRPPAVGPGASHRRVKTSSLDDYVAALELPEPARSARLAELRAAITGTATADPGTPAPSAPQPEPPAPGSAAGQ